MYYDENKKCLTLSDEGSPKNFINILDSDRVLMELYDSASSGKGKNSSVFQVIDPNNEEPDCVVKFCNHHDHLTTSTAEKKRLRFDREIRALEMALQNQQDEFLLNIIDHGTKLVGSYSFRYYVMEKADCDLSQFLERERLTLQQKIAMCDGLLQALRALHDLGIYHRDLKPDNIFFVEDRWKIGDLGFISFRDDDFDLDGASERIGPTGLMSPEATNKNLAIKINPEFKFDCKIDDMSDIFQLGKLFWFIFQGDIPTGQIELVDFKIGDAEIFTNILRPMLQYAKSRRPRIPELDAALSPIRKKFALA